MLMPIDKSMKVRKKLPINLFLIFFEMKQTLRLQNKTLSIRPCKPLYSWTLFWLPPAHYTCWILIAAAQLRYFKSLRWMRNKKKQNSLFENTFTWRNWQIACSIKESAVAHYLLFMLLQLVNYLLGRAAEECSGILTQSLLHQGPSKQSSGSPT